ncbi:Putative cell wall binding repeat-containing protein [Lachnospiraceae bacterium NE2001]|nr:Putative cell wall binding repeat-containing protein [Lachnospiraceae bacterium NE2001]
MTKLVGTIKKLGAMKIVVAIVSAAILFACFGYMTYYMVFLQHYSESDGDFFGLIWTLREFLTYGDGVKTLLKESDYNVWAVFITYVSFKTGVHPLELCHRFIPDALVVFLFVEYLYLGYRLFVIEKKGRYYTVIGTVLFTTAFFFLQYLIRYINPSVHLSVYINPWREHVIAVIAVIPLIIATLLRMMYTYSSDVSKKRQVFRWIRDILILVVEAGIFIFVYGYQCLYKVFKLENQGASYILKNLWETNWAFFMTPAFIVILVLLKMKGVIPIIIISLLAVLSGAQLPLALIISFGIAALVVNPESISLWQPISYLVVGICIYVLAIVSGTCARYFTSFEPVENKYRISGEVPNLVEYLLRDKDEVSVVTDNEMGVSLSQYSQDVECVIVDDVSSENSAFVFDVGLKSGDYVIIRKDIEPTDNLLINDEYVFETMIGDYNIYARSFWEQIEGAWAHKGPSGDYLKDGWYKINNNLYFFGSDGKAYTGWLEWEGEYYYLNEDGKMAMYWQEIEDKWYFFGPDGAMRHDVTEAEYTLGPDGALVED